MSARSLLLLLLTPLSAWTQARLDRHGDELPQGAVARCGTARFRHPGPLKAVAVSRDGKVIALARNNGSIALLDVASGKQVGLLNGHTTAVRSLVLSGDGKTLLSLGSDQTLRRWDVTTRKERRSLRLGESWSRGLV